MGSPTQKTLLVFGRPTRGNRDVNPYTYLLSEALGECGCTVEDFTLRRGLLEKPDVVHIHWPQREVLGPLPTALKKFAWLVARLLVQRLRGTAIVWTVHNLRGHDRNHPGLEAVLMWFITHLVTGLFQLVGRLEGALTENGAFPFAIPNDANPDEALLRDMQFDPRHNGWRYAVGPAGIFHTLDGQHWSALVRKYDVRAE